MVQRNPRHQKNRASPKPINVHAQNDIFWGVARFLSMSEMMEVFWGLWSSRVEGTVTCKVNVAGGDEVVLVRVVRNNNTAIVREIPGLKGGDWNIVEASGFFTSGVLGLGDIALDFCGWSLMTKRCFFFLLWTLCL